MAAQETEVQRITQQQGMRVTVEDIVQAAADGVLRALDARQAAALRGTDLVRSGFFVDFRIRAGGFPPQLLRGSTAELNPQPLPPGPEGR